jgi:hypothetical protein
MPSVKGEAAKTGLAKPVLSMAVQEMSPLGLLVVLDT